MALKVINRKKPIKQKKRAPVLTTFLGFCADAVGSDTRRTGKKGLSRRLDELRPLPSLRYTMIGGEVIEGYSDLSPKD